MAAAAIGQAFYECDGHVNVAFGHPMVGLDMGLNSNYNYHHCFWPHFQAWTLSFGGCKSEFSWIEVLHCNRVMVVPLLSQLALLSSPFRLCNCQLDGVYGCGCHTDDGGGE